MRPRNPFARDPLSRLSPTAAAERWLRSLEEATGSLRYSRRFETGDAGIGSSSAVASSSSSTGIHARNGTGLRKAVPDFIVAGYEETLQRAKEESKILMVVLTCEEHDDDAAFKR